MPAGAGDAAVIGLANGLIVARLNVHGFIATLGMGLIISGYLATNFKGSFGETPLSFRLVGATGLGPVPISTIIMLACAALALLLLHRTRVGHHLYAVGGDIAVARMSGIRVDVPVITAHVICSVLAGMAGLLAGQQAGRGQSNGRVRKAATTCSPSPQSCSAAPCWPAARGLSSARWAAC